MTQNTKYIIGKKFFPRIAWNKVPLTNTKRMIQVLMGDANGVVWLLYAKVD